MKRKTLLTIAIVASTIGILAALNTGATKPVTVVNATGVGTVAWNSPLNATTSDNIYATTTLGNTVVSNYLKATNFGFSIPAGASIDGIVVQIEEKGSVSSVQVNITDSRVSIVKSDGSIGATNKASATRWTTADVTNSYPSSGTTDLWGETWTSTDINNSNFGAVISVVGKTNGASPTGSVDAVSITVYYTPAAVASVQSVQVKTGKLSVQKGKATFH